MFHRFVKFNLAHPWAFALISAVLLFFFGLLMENTANIKDVDDRVLYLLLNLVGYFISLGWLVLLILYLGSKVGTSIEGEDLS